MCARNDTELDSLLELRGPHTVAGLLTNLKFFGLKETQRRLSRSASRTWDEGQSPPTSGETSAHGGGGRVEQPSALLDSRVLEETILGLIGYVWPQALSLRSPSSPRPTLLPCPHPVSDLTAPPLPGTSRSWKRSI